MGGAHEIAEKIEEAAHGGHGGHGHGKYIGLTMAIIGVMLALCSALVGAQRTELIKTMVEQTNAYNEYQASSTKYRVMMADLQQTYASTPSRHLTADALDRLARLPVPKELEPLAAVQREIMKETLQILNPRKAEVEQLVATVERYDEQRKASKAKAESYDDEVHAHFHASESFEHAQLVAEIAIVIASIALLLSSRAFWFGAIGGAVLCGGLMGQTWMATGGAVQAAEHKIEAAREHYEEVVGKKDASGKRLADVRDEETLAKIRERFDLAKPAAEAGGHEGH